MKLARHPLIIGMGRTGQSIQRWYASQGVIPQLYDDRTSNNVEWTHVDVVHPSPGIPLNHPVYEEARRRNILVQSDAHLAQLACPEHRFIGITGSNGKSTTSALVAHLLDAPETPILLGGNIGFPILDHLPTSSVPHTFVWELSSFQLDIGAPLKLDAAAILNLSPNHLDRHGTMECYRAAKLRIVAQAKWGLTGIDLDEENIPIWHVGRECGVREDHIYVLDHRFSFPPYLLGDHNKINAACALAIALHMGGRPDVLEAQLQTFTSLAHRLEPIWEGMWRGKHVRIINDSKSTTAEATQSAFKALPGENIWWIAGGVPKAGGIATLQAWFSRLQHIYLIGQAASDFAQTLQQSGIRRYTIAGTLELSLKEALASIEASTVTSATLLFSPACASFDQFNDFEHRGDMFKEYVEVYI